MFIIVLISTCFISGCGGKLFSYTGGKVTQKDLIVPLEDGNQQGVWKNYELAIEYQYQMASGILTFSGTIEPAGGYKYLNHLAVYLLILDNQGIIIDNMLIYLAGNYRPMVTSPMGFGKKIPVPGGARAISFAYDLSYVQRR
jgi:hypothetical protein